MITSPTPSQQNLTTDILPLYTPADGTFAPSLEVLFRTTPGVTHEIQVSQDLQNWITATTVQGDGIERSVKIPATGQNIYIRVKQL